MEEILHFFFKGAEFVLVTLHQREWEGGGGTNKARWNPSGKPPISIFPVKPFCVFVKPLQKILFVLRALHFKSTPFFSPENFFLIRSCALHSLDPKPIT